MAVMISPMPRGTQKEGSCIFVVTPDVPMHPRDSCAGSPG